MKKDAKILLDGILKGYIPQSATLSTPAERKAKRTGLKLAAAFGAVTLVGCPSPTNPPDTECECTTTVHYADEVCACGLANCNCTTKEQRKSVTLNGAPVTVEKGAGVTMAQSDAALAVFEGAFGGFAGNAKMNGKIAKIVITTGATQWTEAGGMYTLNISRDANAAQIATLLTNVVADIDMPRVYGIKVVGTADAALLTLIQGGFDNVGTRSGGNAEKKQWAIDNIDQITIIAADEAVTVTSEGGKWILKVPSNLTSIGTAGTIGGPILLWVNAESGIAFMMKQLDNSKETVRMAFRAVRGIERTV